MTLDLDQHEADVLRDVLMSTLRELSYEIANTDLSTFKDELKARRTVLEGVLGRLAQPATA